MSMLRDRLGGKEARPRADDTERAAREAFASDAPCIPPTPGARLTYQVSAAPSERMRGRRLLQTGVGRQ